MAKANTRASGPLDSRNFYERWCASSPLLNRLFLASSDCVAFKPAAAGGTLVSTMGYLAWCGNATLLGPSPSRDLVYAGFVADLMSPYILTDKIVPIALANGMFIRAVASLGTEQNLQSIGVNATAAERDAMCNVDNLVSIGYTAAQAGAFNYDHTTEPTTVDEATLALYGIAAYASRAFKPGGVSMLVTCYLSVLKRGNLTNDFMNKVVAGVESDLNVSSVTISVDACNILYRTFDQAIDETTMSSITSSWLSLLPAEALKLRLTVEQTAGAGLTVLVTIWKAFATYTDFPWNKLATIYPDEFQNFTNAVAAVGNNQWYGFKHDLGPVKSTKYKNLAYVAKELLIRIGGEGALARYRRWTSTPKQRAMVDGLIANYEQHLAAKFACGVSPAGRCEVRGGANDSADPIIAAVQAAPLVYV